METLKIYWQKFGKKQGWVTGVVAVGAALAICLEVNSYLSGREIALIESRYLVARRDLPEGFPVNFLDFIAVARSRLKVALPKGALTDQDLHLLKGAIFRSAVSEAEVLCLDQLQLSSRWVGLGSAVPKGFRAYPLHPLNPLPVGQGDKIDILPVSGPDSGTPLVEGVLVLQAGFRDPDFEVIVALSSPDIELLEKGQQKGKLSIALRNPHEAPSARRQGKPRSRKAKSTVEIWSEGA
jgi:Flp pilus assembly protein CpaB